MNYPNIVNSKLPKVGTTIFTVMSKLAVENNAINLSQGFPDFNCNEALSSLVSKFMVAGANQYAPMPGLMSLRERIAEKTAFMYTANYDPETEITITAGATQAIFTAITALINKKDEVIVFEPAYDCYVPAIELSGGKPVFIPLRFPEYHIDWELVKKAINHKTKMIIINTPNNPTGALLQETDMQKLQELINDTKIIILSDEVYEHILFDGHIHQSVARYPKLAKRSIIVSSFGKTYHTTGWKVGYVLAPRELSTEFRKVHQFNVFSVNTPIQHADEDFLKRKEEYTGLGAFYEEKRNFFNKLIKDSRFTLTPSAGTYFQLLGYEKITDEKDTDFAIRLTKDYRLASVPVSVFYHQPTDHKMLRFCFAKKNETLERAAEIICSI